MTLEKYIAATRFGLGLRPNESFGRDAKSWLKAQLTSPQLPPSWKPQSNAPALISENMLVQEERKAAQMAGEDMPTERRTRLVQLFRDAIDDRFSFGLQTQTPFYERLVYFWSNHFAIDAKPVMLKSLAADYENCAIRPRITGRFADLLKSAVLHQAMLIYLDQVHSIGPSSFAGQRGLAAKAQRGAKKGLNENLAREIMELHTLGVNGGYTQTDVEELARALTGHTIAHMNMRSDARAASQNVAPGTYFFVPALHEPGPRRLLGKTYAANGERQLHDILEDLALHPSTAKFLAAKLARHLVSDNPPAVLIDRMSRAYLQNNGSLMSLYNVIIDAPESWLPAAQKFKSPWEWSLSAHRALQITDIGKLKIDKYISSLGEDIWQPGSPAGFSDDFAQWASPNALMRRAADVEALVDRAELANIQQSPIEKLFVAEQLPEANRLTVASAESAHMQWALALILPEFQRR